MEQLINTTTLSIRISDPTHMLSHKAQGDRSTFASSFVDLGNVLASCNGDTATTLIFVRRLVALSARAMRFTVPACLNRYVLHRVDDVR
jgi:hypothetical protein